MKLLTKIIIALLFILPLYATAQHDISPPIMVTGSPGDSIVVPIHLTFDQQAPNAEINAFGLEFKFPHHLLKFEYTTAVGALTEEWIMSTGAALSDSVINIGGFNTTAISTSGDLLYVKFTVREQASGMDSLYLYDFVDDLAGATTMNGLFTTPVAPSINSIPTQQINEGHVFNPVKLDDYVHDMDTPDSLLVWQVSGSVELTTTLVNRILTVAPPDTNWFGEEKLTLIVNDRDGLSDTVAVDYSVINVNDPPSLSDIPDQTIKQGEIFTPIHLVDYVTDIDDSLNALLWSFSGNSKLNISISDGRATITVQDTTWFGSETITFTVTDAAGLSDTAAATFMITYVNNPPQLSDIPDQTITQGENFTAIHLYNYVTDIDDSFNTLLWSFSGNSKLDISISDSTAKITVRDTTWVGSETITFTVKDAAGSADTQTTFTVKAIISLVDSDIDVVPTEFALQQNYPNPFNPSTVIEYAVPSETHITIDIYNSLGQKVRSLVNENAAPAHYTVKWNGTNDSGHVVSPGIYLARLKNSENESQLIKMVFAK